MPRWRRAGCLGWMQFANASQGLRLIFCDPRRDRPRHVRGLSEVLGTCEAEAVREGQREESDEPRALTKMASRVEAPLPLHCSRVRRCRLLRARSPEGIALGSRPTPRSALLRGRFLVKVSRVRVGDRTGTVQCLHRLFGPPQPIATRPTVLPALSTTRITASQHPSLSRCYPDHLQ